MALHRKAERREDRTPPDCGRGSKPSATHPHWRESKPCLRGLDGVAEGGLRGEGLMAGIIALINDARNSMERLDEVPPGPEPPAPPG